MMIHDVTSKAGANRRRKRIGRGESSGQGKTAGRGHKGLKARSGGKTRKLTEGGQMPLFRRIAKRGFSNANFETRFETINLADLERCFDAGATVDLDALRDRRLFQGRQPRVKVLAKGALTKKLTVSAHAFSEKAKAAIEQAGGSAQVVEQLDKAAAAKAKRRTAKDREKQPRVSRLEKKKAARAAQTTGA